jgi:hypothetical protein
MTTYSIQNGSLSVELTRYGKVRLISRVGGESRSRGFGSHAVYSTHHVGSSFVSPLYIEPFLKLLVMEFFRDLDLDLDLDPALPSGPLHFPRLPWLRNSLYSHTCPSNCAA